MAGTQTEFEAVMALRREGKADEALKLLEKVSASRKTALYHYVRGRTLEDLGDYKGALEAYRVSVAAAPGCRAARFRTGYLSDLRGDEDKAVECYEACLALVPNDTAALLNLGTIYEGKGYLDGEYYEKAIRCYEQVLEANPNHARARLALRDAKAAQVMYYDEEQERRRDRRNQVLEIPVTDFELSVRSRNCLKKMNIRTLGDLIMHTDKDLLSYKNFGETSLMEIKEMLASKGLYLGMGLEEQAQKGFARPAPSLLTSSATEPAQDATNAAIPLDSIEFSVRSRKAFSVLGATTLGELAAKSEPDLLEIKNFGQTSLNEVKQKLRRYGLTLAD